MGFKILPNSNRILMKCFPIKSMGSSILGSKSMGSIVNTLMRYSTNDLIHILHDTVTWFYLISISFR